MCTKIFHFQRQYGKALVKTVLNQWSNEQDVQYILHNVTNIWEIFSSPDNNTSLAPILDHALFLEDWYAGLETYFFHNSQTFASGFNLNSQIAVSNLQVFLQ